MQKDIYRECSAIAVFRLSERQESKNSKPVYEVLLVHKPRKKDAWQLPQGGKEEGESIEENALRELQEEASLQAKVFHVSETVYQYEFPKSYRRFRPDNIKGQRICFVQGVATGSTHVQVDQEEIDDFTWVHFEEIPKFIRRKAYLHIVRSVFKEGEEILIKQKGIE